MRIKTQFIMNMVLFGIVLIAVTSLLLITNRQVDNLQAQERTVRNIERAASELSYLSNDYLLYQEQQQYDRWSAKWSAMAADINRLETSNPEDQLTINNIKANHRRLKAVFDNVAAAFQEETETPSPESVQTLIEVSWGRLAVQNQGIAFDALFLSQAFNNRIDSVRQTSNLLALLLLSAFIGYFVINYLIVQRRLLSAITNLQAGAAIVGSGNLDVSLDANRDDEIGDLTSSFNQMASDLKTVTTSKTELESEIAERKAAEQKLYEERERLSVTLASIGDGVIATDTESRIVILNGIAEKLTGWSQQEAIGKPLMEVFNIRDATGKDAANPVAETIACGMPVGLDRDIELVAKNGNVTSIADSCAAIRARDGSVIGAVLVFRDITEEKYAEQLRDSLNDINAAISSTLDIDQIGEAVVVEATKAIGCDTTSIEIRGDGYWEVRYLEGQPKHLIGERFSFEETIGMETAAATMQPFFARGAEVLKTMNKRVSKNFNTKSVMIMPIITKNQVVAAMRFVYAAAPIEFNKAQIDFATKLAASVSLALENARLYAAERHIAETLQAALLRTGSDIKGIEYGHLYRSATESAKVGGDFYNLFELSDNKVGIIIGDVAGKGVSAATLTALVENTLIAFAHQALSPSEVMSKTNDVVARTAKESRFVTVFFSILDPATGQMVYCSGGHPPPLVRRCDGHIERLHEPSPMIGAFEGLQYKDSETRLHKQDILVLFTDGVIESRSGNGEFFGERRLAALLKETINAKEGAEQIFKAVLDFTGGHLTDDVALLTVALQDD